jgi:hypothetical protein
MAAQEILEKIKRKVFHLEDYCFEKFNSFEFSGIIAPNNLSPNDPISATHATFYQAVWCRNMRKLFREAKKNPLALTNFIDIGSGKGKACLYAHKKNQFKKIIGIEFSQQLVDIANKNKRKINAENINFLHADAIDFQLPDEPCLVFMFNPFDNVVLEKFIRNNLRHFHLRKSIIAYANDVERIILLKCGFETIFRDQSRKISLYQLREDVEIKIS